MKVTVNKHLKDKSYVGMVQEFIEEVSAIHIEIEPGPVAKEMGILKDVTFTILENRGGHEIQISCDVGRLNIQPVKFNLVSVSVDYG